MGDDDDFGDFNEWQGADTNDQAGEEEKKEESDDGFGDVFTSAPPDSSDPEPV